MNVTLIFVVLIAVNVVAIVVNTVGARRQRALHVDVVDVDAMFAPTVPAAGGRPSGIAPATPRPSSTVMVSRPVSGILSGAGAPG